MTLASTPEIDEAFRWSRENEHMQYKARRILAEYATGDHERMMIASVMLESFLFYSGFYLPLRMASLGKIRSESIHAKSYSNIFMTLASTPEIDEAFRWSRENEHMQYKARRILAEYATGDHERMMIASVMLESFLFYSGFYLPLRMASLGKI